MNFTPSRREGLKPSPRASSDNKETIRGSDGRWIGLFPVLDDLVVMAAWEE
jgi:hypothetical protein